MKCEKEGCGKERTCFHYCNEHHQEICMAGIVYHAEFVAAQQSVERTGCYACADTGIIRCDGIAINCPVCNPATSR